MDDDEKEESTTIQVTSTRDVPSSFENTENEDIETVTRKRRTRRGKRRKKRRIPKTEKLSATGVTPLDSSLVAEDLSETNFSPKSQTTPSKRRGRRRRKRRTVQLSQQEEDLPDTFQKTEENESLPKSQSVEGIKKGEKKEKEEDGEVEEKKKKEKKKIPRLYEQKKLEISKFGVGNTLYITTKTESRPVFNGIIEKQTENIRKITTMLTKYPTGEINLKLSKKKEEFEKSLLLLQENLKKVKKVDFKGEGIYSGNKPKILEKNLYILKQRCLRQKDGFGKYFDQNGEFIYESDPISLFSTRPNDDFTEFETKIPLRKTIPWITQFNSDKQEYFQLEFECSKIIFEDHCLMNEEEYFCQKLKKLFQNYSRQMRNNLSEYYKNRIRALLESLLKLRGEYSSLNDPEKPTQVLPLQALATDDVSMNIGHRMSNLRDQLKKCRIDLEQQVYSEVQLVNNIILVWNKIKQIRAKNGYITSNLKVEFEKIETDESVESEKIEMQTEMELIELKEEVYWEYKKEMEEYHNIVSKELTRRPKKPNKVEFDDVEEKKKIFQRIMSNTRKPGEPIFIPKLSRTNITKIEDLPPVEKEKQKEIEGLSYFIKLLINGKEVSKTRPSQMGNDFSVYLGEVIPISVLKWPDTICIQVRQNKTVGSSHVASVFVSAPGLEVKEGEGEQAESVENPKVKNLEKLRFNGVAPYLPVYELQKGNVENQKEHYTSGFVKFRMAWTSTEQGEQAKAPPVPKSKDFDGKRFENYLPTAKDLLDMQKMKLWMKGNTIDPNDPKNTGLMSMFELIENKNLTRKGYYLTEHNDSLFIDESRKHKQKMEKLKEPEKKTQKAEFVGKYVIEPERPTNIWKFFSWIWDIFAPRRPLKPDRLDRSREKTSIGKRKLRIYIQIIRLINVPKREFENYTDFRKQKLSVFAQSKINTIKKSRHAMLKEEEGGEEEGEKKKEEDEVEEDDTDSDLDEDIEMEDTNVVTSFVEVYFQEKSKRTQTLRGSFPQFNETLVLPFKMKNNDYSPESVSRYNDTIYFDVFDQITISTVRDERQINIEKKRTEERWLGSFYLPFTTLYSNSQIYGNFVCEAPLINLGYDYDKEMRMVLNITLDPPLPLPRDIVDLKSSGESHEITTYCSWWVRAKKKFSRTKKRKIVALVPNLYGKGTLVCRYVCPQKPPPDLSTDFMLLRFVSMVPFLEDILFFEERTDVWTTSQHFLDNGGDYEEHAILLCNYFLYGNKKAWVLIGNSVPEGETAFVLTKEDGVYYFWNPSTGVRFAQDDQNCPITSVGCVFDQNNVWANVSTYDRVSKINFDFSNKYNWEPMFQKKNLHLYNKNISIQTELEYKKKNLETALLLENELTRCIRAEIAQKRVSFPHFKFHLENDLRQILKDLETSKLNNISYDKKRQKQILTEYDEKNMMGVPLNFKKISEKRIVQQVINTKIHEIGEGESNVCFATGVYVHPFFNDIFSIWVYVIALFEQLV